MTTASAGSLYESMLAATEQLRFRAEMELFDARLLPLDLLSGRRFFLFHTR